MNLKIQDEYPEDDWEIWTAPCQWCGEPVNMEVAESDLPIHPYCIKDYVKHADPSKTVIRQKRLDKIANIIDTMAHEGSAPKKYVDRLRELIGEK